MKTLDANRKLIFVSALLISVGLFAAPIAAAISPVLSLGGHFWARGHYEEYISYMESDLYGFGHMRTPHEGYITDWQVSEVHYNITDWQVTEKILEGNFTVVVFPVVGEPSFIEGGNISISFSSKVDRIPLFEGEPDAHVDFRGQFKITGGTYQYETLKGSGDIAGTIHLHSPIDIKPPYYDFVLIGDWKT